MAQKKNKNSGAEMLLVVGAVVLLVLVGLNAFMASNLKSNFEKMLAEYKEKARPADISIIKITYPCDKCFSAEDAASKIRNLDVSIVTEKEMPYDAKEAEALISKYNIKKLPSVVVTGEIEKDNVKKSWKRFGEIREDAFVFTKQKAPYYDVQAGKIKGFVEVTVIGDKECEQCIDLSQLTDAFKEAGVVIEKEASLDFSDSEASSLIEKYEIKKIPALIVSSDIREYDSIKDVWDVMDVQEKDGYYVLHTKNPPYRDTQTGEIKGIVTLIELSDKNCSECYNVTVHENVLRRFGMALGKIEKYDISDSKGKEIIEKYNITKVPTILLSPEASEYERFVPVWRRVGTIEDDGWLVFREIEAAFGENVKYITVE